MTANIQVVMAEKAAKTKEKEAKAAQKGKKKSTGKENKKKGVIKTAKVVTKVVTAKGDHKVTAALRAAMPFPGKPKAREAMEYKDFKIYTDVAARTWRVKRNGERKDRSASFKADPQQAWVKVLKILAGEE